MADVIGLLNGPNLNLLGTREPATYGNQTLDDVVARCQEVGRSLGLTIDAQQSNHEGDLVDAVQRMARDGVLGVVINAGAFTHTSVALRDALAGVGLPFVEVHISNVYAREPFRHTSYLSPLASGIVVGCGTYGYELGVRALGHHLGLPLTA
ncbi:MAG: type II 3-dehydroquinate dehydratase [Dermatophilaceae bacterium]